MVVINDDLEKPRGIAVDPGDGYVLIMSWLEPIILNHFLLSYHIKVDDEKLYL